MSAALLVPSAHSASAPSDVPANPFDYVHVTQMTYDPVTGLLKTSTTEPGIPSVCSVKTDTPDAYGNPGTVTIANCAGAAGRALFPPRTVTTTHAAAPSQVITVAGTSTTVAIAAGVALTSTIDTLSQETTYQTDPRFGTTIQVTKPGSRVTKTELDDFGRVTRITAPDNTSSVQGYCLLTPGGALDTSQTSNSPGCSAYASSFAVPLVPPRAYTVIYQQDYAVDSSRNGPLKFTFHDVRGRVLRVASESFDGPTQTAGFTGAWVVTDSVYDAYGNAVLQTSPYYLSNGSARTTGSNDVAVTMTQFDALGRPIANYSSSSADASTTQTFGSGGSFGYGAYGTRKAALTLQTYAGPIITETNDKGATRTTEKNVVQAVARVTDTTGAQVAFQYDSFGNLIKTTDALQNSRTTTVNYIGHAVATYDPDRGLTSTCLDAIGQVKAMQTSSMRGSDLAQACPDQADNGSTATQVAQWTTYAYDVAGRLVEEYGKESKNHFYFGKYSDGVDCDSKVSTLCESTMTSGLNVRRYYDTIGRQVGERKDVVGDGITFGKQLTFDPVTARLSTVTYPTGVQVKYTYTSVRGFVQGLNLVNGATINPLPDANNVKADPLTLAAGSSLWQADVMSADGKYEQTTLGSHVVVQNTYEPGTGRPATVTVGPSNNLRKIEDYAVTWDSLGNASTRLDNLGAGTGSVKEFFYYDTLNRLSNYTVQSPDPGLPGFERTVQLGYNALGMLLSKSDVGNYVYNAQGARHPHALQTLNGAASTGYGYDGDGNMLSASTGKYATLTYTSDDLIATADNADQSIRYSWIYDQANARVKETRVTATNTRKTWYDNTADGLFFESENDSDLGGTTNRHYLMVDGMTIGVLQTNAALPILPMGQFATVPSSVTFNKFEYWHRDNLGSLVATSDHLMNVTAHYSYDPFGLRRFAGGAADIGRTLIVDWDATHNSGTARGFTGHEQLDDIGLVNMNGRLYDAGIAVVIQADPTIPDAYNLQSYNNYAYVLNNPLNATDPTGFTPDGAGTGFSSGSGFTYSGLSDGSSFWSGAQTSLYWAQWVFLPTGFDPLFSASNWRSEALAVRDGWNDNRTSGSRTNDSGGWIGGRATRIVVDGGIGTVKLASDLYRLNNPLEQLVAGVCPQCTLPMFTPLGSGLRDLRNGQLKPMDAARNVGLAISGVPGRIKEDFRTGGWQEGVSQVLAFAATWYLPTRVAALGELSRGGTVISETASGTSVRFGNTAQGYKATFGSSASTDYRGIFFEANPHLEGKVIVHHAVEQQVMKRFPGVVTESELHSLENLRGIPKEINSELHLSAIRKEWNEFYRNTPNPTRQQLLDKATHIDMTHGSKFNPPVGAQ